MQEGLLSIAKIWRVEYVKKMFLAIIIEKLMFAYFVFYKISASNNFIPIASSNLAGTVKWIKDR